MSGQHGPYSWADAMDEIDRLAAQLRELSECVLHGWTDPAFCRGPLHERAVEIAREVCAA